MLPKHVRKKRAKGRTYYYFDLGVGGLKRLPDIRDPEFGKMLAICQAMRTKQENALAIFTVSRLADLYEKSPKFKRLAPRTRRNYELFLDAIRKRIGPAPANLLEPKDIRLVRDEMADNTGAANQFVRVLGALYAWARKQGHVTAKPTEGVELFEAQPYLKWPEWLVEEALKDANIRLPVALLYYTAQRIGDVCAMRWSDIRDGAITITQQKTDKTLTVPFHRDLAAILAETPKNALTLLCRGQRAMRVDYLRKTLEKWASERGQKVVPHGLRKNAVIALLECGCSVAEVSAISGQTLELVEHYAKERDQAKLGRAAILRWNKSGRRKPE